ncbi:uncharacterized protein LOC121393214 [Xenopus laevis]|uniref:Uncharacterized protein LOC121393214 n=1 Tax=Xenopus laevis TaxID=8355 RepID=A0A8J1KI66_XENLA|nr:uncharacterized protein LOC121393214 [Xenopus laevis]
MGESNLLNHGLKFVPTNTSEPFEVFKDIHRFKRQLKLKDHFKGMTQVEKSPFTKKSSFEPPNTAHTISTFTQLLTRDSIKIHQMTKKGHSNLTRLEKEAITTVKADRDIIIRQADKGGAIVLLDKYFYIQEILNQLGDQTTYQSLPNDPTSAYKLKLDKVVGMGITAGWITESTGQYLTTDFPRTPFMYTLPKVHKSMTTPPGRPIISATGSLFQPIAKFLDHFLQPLVQRMESYIKDTKHLLSLLKDVQIPDNCLLVTMDVSSLYTVIPHREGIATCERALQKYHQGSPPVDFLILLLDMILSHNYFIFQNSFFLQISGTAMGSNVAPSFANLYMQEYETEWLLPMGGSNILFYKRYIDDLLLIWAGSPDDLLSFNESLNSLESPIKLTMSFDPQEIHYLDVTIFKEGNNLGTTLYKKPTDRNSLIYASSHHPPHMSRGVLYSQFLRVVRNNSDPSKAELQLTDLADQFLSRGYSPTLIEEQLRRAKKWTQEDLLQTNMTVKPSPELIFTSKWTTDICLQCNEIELNALGRPHTGFRETSDSSCNRSYNITLLCRPSSVIDTGFLEVLYKPHA